MQERDLPFVMEIERLSFPNPWQESSFRGEIANLHISYPSPRDIQESAAAGVNPGGMIMIHGHPPEAQTNPGEYAGKDWTNGCIALQNDDMDIVWSSIADGTPIDILP